MTDIRKSNLKPDLQWGETPWDNMSREELLLEVRRMFAACAAMYSCMAIGKAMRPGLVYYSPEGAGGKAWERGRQVVEPLLEQYGDRMHLAFFRYAADLLFEPSEYHRPEWVICPVCGDLHGGENALKEIGKVHKLVEGRGECNGVIRRLEWADLHPERQIGG